MVSDSARNRFWFSPISVSRVEKNKPQSFVGGTYIELGSLYMDCVCFAVSKMWIFLESVKEIGISSSKHF